MSTIAELTRAQKRDVAAGLLDKIQTLLAKQAAAKEEALAAFEPLFAGSIAALNTGVDGKVVANAARKAQLARSEKADSDVDTSFRHHYDYINNEAIRRVGPYVLDAIALRDAAFPDGLGPVDAYIPVENQAAKSAIAALHEEAHAKTATNIGLPAAWTTKWEAEIAESDAAFADVQYARNQASATVDAGLDAEDAFVDLAIRFRRYVQSRAARSDKAKQAEGVELLAPLSNALAKARTDAAARATRRKTDAGAAPAGGSSPDAAPKADSPKAEPK